MAIEYAKPSSRLRTTMIAVSEIGGDFRNPASEAALDASIPPTAEGGLFLSIGGGPKRIRASLVNLNIGPFENVDVVGDAHTLPYADESVDGAHCEAVLEHVSDPQLVVSEMSRTLRRGARAFVATPFLQAFHGYPDHYQNFTRSGHRKLFERADLLVLEAGTCVGPAFAICDIFRNFLRTQFPAGVAGKTLARASWPLLLPVRVLDIWLARDPRSIVLCSSTYALVEKR